MALNVLMHPRNPYRDRRPDFKALAEKYEMFREHVTSDVKGKVHVDFKNPACLRALTCALLKDDFQLDIKMPLDRLIPTVPLRLNYILWLEDIFSLSSSRPLKGIDIGTGASCIYPLLGAQTRGWHFIATEADPINADYAVENVARNDLSTKIRVVQVSADTTLSDSLGKISNDSSSAYDFCMCNPPFFGSNLEAWGWLTTRGVGLDGVGDRTRPEPSSVSTASPVESIAPGGEVQFVQQKILESSLELQSRVRVYSTMLGKKTSVSTLKERLKMNGIKNIGTTEFCQGKTMRWGLAWSFDDTVIFPKPVSKVVKAQKPRPPIVHTLPAKYNSIASCAESIESIFRVLQASYTKAGSEAGSLNEKVSWVIKCPSNTWSHQRRRRRQQKRLMLCEHDEEVRGSGAETTVTAKRHRDDDHNTSSDGGTTPKKIRLDCIISEGESIAQTSNEQPVGGLSESEHSAEDQSTSRQCRDFECVGRTGNSSGDSDYLLKSEVAVRKSDSGNMVIELSWIDGKNRELLHQLLQFFKNHLV